MPHPEPLTCLLRPHTPGGTQGTGAHKLAHTHTRTHRCIIYPHRHSGPISCSLRCVFLDSVHLQGLSDVSLLGKGEVGTHKRRARGQIRGMWALGSRSSSRPGRQEQVPGRGGWGPRVRGASRGGATVCRCASACGFGEDEATVVWCSGEGPGSPQPRSQWRGRRGGREGAGKAGGQDSYSRRRGDAQDQGRLCRPVMPSCLRRCTEGEGVGMGGRWAWVGGAEPRGRGGEALGAVGFLRVDDGWDRGAGTWRWLCGSQAGWGRLRCE